MRSRPGYLFLPAPGIYTNMRGSLRPLPDVRWKVSALSCADS